jgi:hypothetical protein
MCDKLRAQYFTELILRTASRNDEGIDLTEAFFRNNQRNGSTSHGRWELTQ